MLSLLPQVDPRDTRSLRADPTHASESPAFLWALFKEENTQFQVQWKQALRNGVGRWDSYSLSFIAVNSPLDLFVPIDDKFPEDGAWVFWCQETSHNPHGGSLVRSESSARAKVQSSAPPTSALWTLFLLAHLTQQVKLPAHSKPISRHCSSKHCARAQGRVGAKMLKTGLGPLGAPRLGRGERLTNEWPRRKEASFRLRGKPGARSMDENRGNKNDFTSRGGGNEQTFEGEVKEKSIWERRKQGAGAGTYGKIGGWWVVAKTQNNGLRGQQERWQPEGAP